MVQTHDGVTSVAVYVDGERIKYRFHADQEITVLVNESDPDGTRPLAPGRGD